RIDEVAALGEECAHAAGAIRAGVDDGGDIVNGDGGEVIGEAAVAVGNSAMNHAAARAIGQETGGDGCAIGKDAAAVGAVADFEDAVVVEVVAVLEAGRDIGAGRVGGTGEDHEAAGAFVDGAE